ncbi:MAG: type II toxin-antitoxin system RelE/ParE family toxin [Thermincolia bacterium]
MYEIRYLPLARKDLADIATYLAEHLKAPKAAMDLLNALDESISRLEQFPYSYKVFMPIKGLENEYRLLPVKNYAVLYMVKEQVVEIHRVVYAKMDLAKVIK